MNHQSSFSLRSFFQPVDLTQGTCWKTLLVFAFPIIVSYLLQQVYSISDAAIVGQTLTASEVAGVNDTTSLAMIFLQFAFGASAGFCTVTSCFVGARDSAGVRRSMATQIVLSAVLTAVLTALALALLDPMLAWINVTPASREVYRAAYTYCAILFGGIGAQLFYNFICSFLRSMGDSATPLAFLLFSTILNVGLDLLFILSFHWGVAGAAIATVAAQLISTLGCFLYAFLKYPELRLHREDWRITRRDVTRHLIQGIPLGLQFSVLAIGIIVMQSVIVQFDTLGGEMVSNAAQNGFGAANKLNNLLTASFAEDLPFTRFDNGAAAEATVYALPGSDAEPLTYGLYMGGDIAETVIRTDRPELPNALIFGDSFTNPVECLAYYSFNELRSVDLRHYTVQSLSDYIAAYQPDVVLCVRDYQSLLLREFNGDFFS